MTEQSFTENARLIKHPEINYNSVYQQNKAIKYMMNLIDAENAFQEFNTHLICFRIESLRNENLKKTSTI